MLREFIIGKFHGFVTKYLERYLAWGHETGEESKAMLKRAFYLLL